MRAKHVYIIRQAILYARAGNLSAEERDYAEYYRMHNEFEAWANTLPAKDKPLAHKAWMHEYLSHLSTVVQRISTKLEKFSDG